VDTRDALVAAATELLDEGGPERVTLREVGRRVGVSHNAPYKHFADKSALLEEIIAREFERMANATVTTPQDDTPAVDLLRDALLEYARWAVEHPRRFELANGLAINASPGAQERVGLTWRRLVELTAVAQEQGGLPAGDPERLAAMARSLAHGAAELQITGHLSPHGKGRANAADLINDLFAVWHRT
jgi:AcrR family transcriptional regulator